MRLEGWRRVRSLWPSFETVARKRMRPPQDEVRFSLGKKRASLWLDAGRGDHLAPFLVVVAQALGIGLGRGADHLDADRGHALVETSIGDDRVDLAVERGDDLGCGAGGGDKPDAGADLEA